MSIKMNEIGTLTQIGGGLSGPGALEHDNQVHYSSLPYKLQRQRFG